MSEIKTIYCCGCEKDITASLTDGGEIYPHRSDLSILPFWKCDNCKNYVGCHHKTRDRTKPLGCIPTKEIKNARKEIHKILDPLWKNRALGDKNKIRDAIYATISSFIGKEYHTAEIRSIKEAQLVYKIVRDLKESYR